MRVSLYNRPGRSWSLTPIFRRRNSRWFSPVLRLVTVITHPRLSDIDGLCIVLVGRIVIRVFDLIRIDSGLDGLVLRFPAQTQGMLLQRG
jgi:hypothetical protein